MVKLLGRTQGSGGLGFLPREKTAALLAQAGFQLKQIVSLARGSTTPHVLFIAQSS